MLSTRVKCPESSILSSSTLSRDSVFRAFLQQPRQTGAVFSSSIGLARRLVALAETKQADNVVELGSGTGVVTEQLIRQLPDTCRLISLEIDRSLALQAQSRCPTAEVFVSDAAHLRELLDDLSIENCGAVVSSIPWANIDTNVQQSILDSISESLAPGGCFTTFTYVHGMWLPGARRFYNALRSRYQHVETSEVIWANVPPAIIYKVTKK